jgi:hypothetical protein
VFDSNGPDVRIRGTAHQIHEKYMALAKDATGSGDRILAESYLQHAEHYQRIINSWKDDNREQQQQRAADAGETSGNEQPVKPARKKSTSPQEDDLGLPASILGEDAKTEELEDA